MIAEKITVTVKLNALEGKRTMRPVTGKDKTNR
jgi:hypothetical protein